MGLKKLVKKSFLGKLAVSELHCVLCRIVPRLISDEKAIIRHYKKTSGGRAPDLAHPERFSEKQQWYKLHARLALMQKCANKYTVREYVQEAGYGDLLNDLLFVGTDPKQIDYDALPDRFAIKATHGSGFNIIVKDKNALNVRQTNCMLRSWMRQNIYWSAREWVYRDMPRHIIIEKYLEDESGGLLDYKFYCFNGEPRFLQLEVGRYTKNNTRNFYDTDWNLLPFGKSQPHDPDAKIEKPEQFEYMKQIAKDLSRPFQYVRVDLYQVGGKVYFGELTFFPADGRPDFVPDMYDKVVGDMWTLQDIPNEL